MRVSLKEILPDAVGRNRVTCGFNIFGYEDAVAVIEAAEEFVRKTGVDVLAVSVGNFHRLISPTTRIDFNRLGEIETAIPVPLVIHGVSGLPESDIRRLLSTGVTKFNIGTRLRTAFGKRLQNELRDNPAQSDRLQIMKSVIPAIKDAALNILSISGW